MTYIVSPSILKRMGQMGTTPASDEIYTKNQDGSTAWSDTIGMDGKTYRYLAATSQVLAFDPTSWVIAGSGPDPQPPSTTLWPSPERVADILGAPLANVQSQWPLLHAALEEQGIADRATKIAAIATVGVESSSFLPIEEYRNADGSIPSYWHGYDGGATFHGRGLIQLTHRYNYKHYGDALGIDLVNNPSLALDPTISARVFALYFKQRGIHAMANKPDWYAVRVAVNGSPPRGWQRFADLVDALVAL